jgi:hypothetical protein
MIDRDEYGLPIGEDEIPVEPPAFREAFDLANDALVEHGADYEEDTETAFDYDEVNSLYDKDRVRVTGKSNRVPLQITITPETNSAFRDFVETFTGVEIVRGRGAMSPLGELALRMLVSVIADWNIEEVAKELGDIIANPSVREQVRENMKKFAITLLAEESN